ncbi:aegerolysin family protein [Kitasatospora sp. NPDC058406]|uniref:aegerolysin family protein n=1 Tax=Kitasatospora sp. NPDC058406 TaxID=3346483 RepID=UPI00365D7352
MSEQMFISCTINNRTKFKLKVQKYDLSYGKWEDVGNFPPIDIPAGKELAAFHSSGRKGAAAGTEGYVIYELGDDSGATIKIYWDIPWGSSTNTLKVEPSDPDISVNIKGWVGSGAGEAPVLTVHDDRG